MKNPRTRPSVDWGHLALLAVISGVVIAYLLDARSVSLRTNNLLLVQPAAIIALALVALVLPQVFRRRDSAVAADGEDGKAAAPARGPLLPVAILGAAFAVFVFGMERIGFDVATFLFVAVGLWVCGERRLWLIAVFSAVFTAAVIYGYQLLVPYPFPLTVL